MGAGQYQLEVAHPAWLAALALLPLILLVARRSQHNLRRWAAAVSLGLRMLTIACLVAALVEVRLVRTTRLEFPVFAVDRSASILTTGESRDPDAWVRQAAEGADSRTIGFAGDVTSDGEQCRDPQATNLSRAIEDAAALAPPDRAPHVVLLSDGNETAGQALRTAQAARNVGIRISTVPLSARPLPPPDPPPPPRVLVVAGEPRPEGRLANILRSRGIGIDQFRPADLPMRSHELEKYHLVVLSNEPARAFNTAQLEALRDFVHDYGGGLLVLGGDQAFTPGGYRGSLLDEILPVSSEVDEKRPPLAMVLVLDRSQSMLSGDAIVLAKEALRRGVNMLESDDQVGLLVFNETTQWVWPLGPCGDKKEILRQIDTIAADGRTDMYPAIERAYLALEETQADVRHILVLTDGVSHPGDFEALAARIGRSGITLSTVALGHEASQPLLRRMAEVGHGRFFACDDPASVPRVFSLDVAAVSRSGIREKPFLPRIVAPSPLLEGLDLDRAPSLLGYVETHPRPTDPVLLAAEGGRPLLVERKYGNGTCLAFTSEAEGPWAAAWLRWPGYDRFWTRVMERAMWKHRRTERPDPDPSLPAETRTAKTNRSLLRQIAEVTGGTYDPAPSEIISSEGELPATVSLWPWLLGAAILLFVVDTRVKRI